MIPLLLLGCAPEVSIEVSPAAVDLGTVDFAQDMPDEGYNAVTVRLTNRGEAEVSLAIEDGDPDHLCLAGYPSTDYPVPLADVPPGEYALLVVGACGQEPGEVDTTVETAVVLGVADADDIVIPVTFVSTRSDL